MASMGVSVQVDTGASADQVFAVLTDPTNMSLWLNGVQSTGWAAGSGLEPGGRFNMKYRFARRVNDITMEVTTVEPGSRYEYHTVAGPYPIEAKYSLQPVQSGTAITCSQVLFSDSRMTAFVFMVTGWFAKRMARRQLHREIAKLAALATTPDGEPTSE